MIFSALETHKVQKLQTDGLDDYKKRAQHSISDGQGNPCRHCLKDIPEGAGMLILAHRPFEGRHAYAETGPIFLCSDACERGGGRDVPPILTTAPDYLIKGYSSEERIVYGTGAIVPAESLTAAAEHVFADPGVAYIHVRSARNNCYQLRIDRE